MQSREKIGIIIVIILIVAVIIFLMTGILSGKKNNANNKINCQQACHQVSNMRWTFPGAGPITRIIFSTKDECISACQARSKK